MSERIHTSPRILRHLADTCMAVVMQCPSGQFTAHACSLLSASSCFLASPWGRTSVFPVCSQAWTEGAPATDPPQSNLREKGAILRACPFFMTSPPSDFQHANSWRESSYTSSRKVMLVTAVTGATWKPLLRRATEILELVY